MENGDPLAGASSLYLLCRTASFQLSRPTRPGKAEVQQGSHYRNREQATHSLAWRVVKTPLLRITFGRHLRPPSGSAKMGWERAAEGGLLIGKSSFAEWSVPVFASPSVSPNSRAKADRRRREKGTQQSPGIVFNSVHSHWGLLP